LVRVDDDRTALAMVLLLQEFGHAVDVVGTSEAVVAWAGVAPYNIIILGDGEATDGGLRLALNVRYAAPTARVILLGDDHAPADGLDTLRIEVLRQPINVNQLAERLRPAA